jgi:NTP pyrophosphatase (non-canonical NTP hydrolase)
MNRQDIYEEALLKWGAESQIYMLIEEMAELTKAVCKYYRGKRTQDDVLEEMVDVEIMIEQMKIIFDYNGRFNELKKKKLKRLHNMLLGRE